MTLDKATRQQAVAMVDDRQGDLHPGHAACLQDQLLKAGP